MSRPLRPPGRAHAGALVPVIVFLGAATAGCGLDVTNVVEDTAWTAEIFVLPDEETVSFGGQAAMISGPGQTVVSITFFEATQDQIFGWFVRFGKCTETGPPLSSQINAFPLVAIDLDGAGEAFAVLQIGITAQDDFAVVVLDDPFGGTGRIVGCGDMVEVVE